MAATPGGPAQPTSPVAGPDPRAMQDVIAQVQQLDDLEPAMRQQLLEDLKQTDPRLWPGVIRQFQAMLAYRRQVEQRPQQPSGGAAGEPAALAGVSGRPAGPVAADAVISPASVSAAASMSPTPSGTPASVGANMGTVSAPGTKTVGGPVAAPQASGHSLEAPGLAEVSPSHPDRKVVPTSYEELPADPLRGELEQVIRSMEARVSNSPHSTDEVAEHARLRMLYLLAGRREDAFRSIPSAAPSLQDFWSKELYGLAVMLDTQRAGNSERRAAESRQHLGEALDSLAHSSPLVVRNLAFLINVDDYGIYRPFTEYKFVPGQEVIVYAEIENFQSESTPKGYVTSLRFGCEVFDSRGQRVAQHEFKSDDLCRNQRRDFFIGCQFNMPERIYDGPHTLKLTVEDLKSQKIGQQSIEFTIADAKK